MDALQGYTDLGVSGRSQGLAANANAAAKAAVQSGDKAAMRKAAEDFEAVFISRMLEDMTADLPVDSMFGGGQSETIFRSMMNEQYAKEISARGGVGVADSVYRVLLSTQEMGHDASARNSQ